MNMQMSLASGANFMKRR